MGKRKRSSNGHDDAARSSLPLNEHGHVPNGFTISFEDFEDAGMMDYDDDDDEEGDQQEASDDDIQADDEDAAEAPRGGPGSQVLPVAYNVPDTFEGEPSDGSEYLFLVR